MMREDCPRHKGIMTNFSQPCICDGKETREEELLRLTKSELIELTLKCESRIVQLEGMSAINFLKGLLVRFSRLVKPGELWINPENAPEEE